MKVLLYFLWVSIWVLVAFSSGVNAANDVLAFVVVCTAPLVISFFIKRKRKKKQEITQPSIPASSTEQPVDSYIKAGNVTYRTDGKPISDAEVPFLIQAGLENALRREQESSNPKFHRTFHEQDLSFEFSMKHGEEADKRTEKFDALYKAALQEKNLAKRIEILNNAVIAFEKAKNFCYSKGKGGTIYFQDTWEYMHNSERPCYSYLDKIQEELKEAIQERDVFIPSIIDTISSNNGLLQKNIYDLLPEIPKTVIQRIIRNLEIENKLERIKKSGSYELHIIK